MYDIRGMMSDWDKPKYKRMIEVLEFASRLDERGYSGYGIDISDIDFDYLYDETFGLIESLRIVARAANYFLNGNWDFKEGSDAYDRHEMLIDALDALPSWVLEGE